MIKLINKEIKALKLMKKAPKELYYIGDLSLLDNRCISIVGTRRPSQYTKDWTYKLSRELSKRGVVIVSGAAMGVDAIAHKGAIDFKTIAVMANGLDIKYPAVNKTLIENIEKKGLVLSFFKEGFRATKWSFVSRNELVVALGEALIVTEANLNSGSLRSVEFALKMGKKIYVLPHRLSESPGTNNLLKNSLAEPIYDIEEFVNKFGEIKKEENDFIKFLDTNPTLNEAISKFGSRVYEAELEGLIIVEDGLVKVVK